MSNSKDNPCFNSKIKYPTSYDGKLSRAYSIWSAMVGRCYPKEYGYLMPTYLDCTIEQGWHDFQNFAEWFYSHDYSDLGYQLDKDLLVPKNKLYSAETCCFLPRELNMAIAPRKSSAVDDSKRKVYSPNKFPVTIGMNGKTSYIGSFSCPYEADRVYAEIKERYVKNKAIEWANRIEFRAFKALMLWKVPCGL